MQRREAGPFDLTKVAPTRPPRRVHALLLVLALIAVGGASAPAAQAVTGSSGDGLGPAIATDREGTTHFARYVSNSNGSDSVEYCQIPRGSDVCSDSTRKTLTVAAPCTIDADEANNTSQSSDDLKVLLTPFGEVFVVVGAVCKTSDDPKYHERSFLFRSTDDGATFGAAEALGRRGDSTYYAADHYTFTASVLDPADRRVVSILAKSQTGSGSPEPDGVYVQGAPLGTFTASLAQLGTSVDRHPTIVQRARGSFVAAWSDGTDYSYHRGKLQIRAYDCATCALNDINDASHWTTLTIPGVESDTDRPKLVSGPLGTFLLYRRIIDNGGSYANSYRWYTRRIDGSTVGAATEVPYFDLTGVDTYYMNVSDVGPATIFEDQANGRLHFARVLPGSGVNGPARVNHIQYMVSGDGTTWSKNVFLPHPGYDQQAVFGNYGQADARDPLLSVSTGDQGFTGVIGIDPEPGQNTYPPYPIFLEPLDAISPPNEPPPTTGTTPPTTGTTPPTTGTTPPTDTTPTSTMPSDQAPPTGTSPGPSTSAPATDKRCRILQFGPLDVLADSCLSLDGTDVVAKDGVSVNGLRITGAELRFNPKQFTVKSADAVTISIGDTRLGRAKIDWKLPHGNTFELPSIDVGKLGSPLLGFGLKGEAEPKLVRGAVEIPVTIGLPSILGGITSEITLRADNLAGLHVRELKLAIGEAKIGPLEIGGASLSYSPEDKHWTGGVKLTLPPDPPAPALSGEIGFRGGDLEYLKAELELPGNGIPLDPTNVAYLTKLRASLETKPLALGGGITFAAGPKLDGDLRAATIDGDVKVSLPTDKPITIRADGKVALMTIPIADAFLQFVADGHVTAGGHIGYDLGPASLDGRIDGWFYKGDFSLDGKAEICLVACAGGEVVVSSVGMAACASIGPADVGAGIKWSADLAAALINPLYLLTHVDPMPTGCDVGPYRPAMTARQAGAAPPGVTLPKGLPSAFIGVSGATGPPQVALVGPDGTRIEPKPGAPVRTTTAFAFQLPKGRYTWFAIKAPAAGRWSVVAAAGSTPVTGVRSAQGLPAPEVTAQLSRQGSRRVLRYEVTPIPGQHVTFAEQGSTGAAPIGRATGSTGTLRFTPRPGGGTRAIVARVAQDGIPRVNLTVAHFVAPPRPHPARPRSLRLVRRGTRLTVSFRRGANSRRDFVFVALSDGRRLMLRAKSGRAVVTGVEKATTGTVSASGEDTYGVSGPKATAKLRAVTVKKKK